jgi:hypothetical protein
MNLDPFQIRKLIIIVNYISAKCPLTLTVLTCPAYPATAGEDWFDILLAFQPFGRSETVPKVYLHKTIFFAITYSPAVS